MFAGIFAEMRIELKNAGDAVPRELKKCELSQRMWGDCYPKTAKRRIKSKNTAGSVTRELKKCESSQRM